jgi:ABC-2 type transport system permease protein
MARLIVTFARLRWRLLRASLSGSGSEKAGVILSTVGSAVVGGALAAALINMPSVVASPGDVLVIVTGLVPLAIVGIGLIAGVAQPVDPRVLAVEPLRDGQRAVGLLVATAAGPPGLAGVLVGIGLVVGGIRADGQPVVVVAATVTWLLTLLLVSRTSTNVLGLISTRYSRLGQVIVGVGALVVYGAFQVVPGVVAQLDVGERADLAELLDLTPLGQIGRAASTAEVGDATLHLVAGASLLPILAVVYLWTTARLTSSVRRTDAIAVRTDLGGIRGAVRRLCGAGGAGAIAWRSVLTRFRTPRTALETFTGAGVGLAAVLVPVLVRDGVGSGAVLVGGAVQLAVLFMAGNSFGSDGPPLTYELLAGAGPHVLAAGKARSIAIVAAPVAVVGPLLAAGVTGEWTYLPAGFLVGAGALLAGTGGALVQSTLVPIAIPDSDNPFASGESGRGAFAAVILAVVLLGLAVVTLPVALGLLWANDRRSVVLVTLLGAVALTVGYGLFRGGIEVSTRHLRSRGPEFVAAITPSR